jgi:arylsulfatase A-like enzyme/Flp pilus assembly protein TadD
MSGMRMTRGWLRVLFLCVIAVELPGTAVHASVSNLSVQPASPQQFPNVLLVTLDTTRADRMGFLGSKRGLTPNLDALAQQSAVFTRAYAQAPLTSASHATILTGTYPQFHQVLNFPTPLSKDLPYGPAVFRAHGYRTAAFLGSLVLDAAGGAPGFDRGFDVYDASFHPENLGVSDRYHSLERRAEDVVGRALGWLKEHPKGPFFLWVHLYDAHDPYDPPEPYKTRFAAEPYDGEIAYVDANIGKLFQELKAHGLFDDTLVAIMADHGEALGAHGEETHGTFVYDETIHVPLLIKLPRGRAAGQRIENRVELVDVMPTLLRVANLELPSGVQGRSLLSLMGEGGTQAGADPVSWPDSAYSRADYPHLSYGWAALQSLRTGKYLYIDAPRQELYDQTIDPKAEHDIASASSAVSDTLAERVRAFHTTTANKREAPAPVVDPARERQLAALGYVVSSGNRETGNSSRQQDPKDHIEIANKMEMLNIVIEQHRFADAIPQLQELIAHDPVVSILHFKLGTCFMGLKQFGKAIPAFRKAVELDGGFTLARIGLGNALLASLDYDQAVVVFEELSVKLPMFPDVAVPLEVAYFRSGRLAEAVQQCKKVLELAPNQYDSQMILGRALAGLGELQEAADILKKAIALRPNIAEPHIYLSDVYDRLGRGADAEAEREAAQNLGVDPE